MASILGTPVNASDGGESSITQAYTVTDSGTNRALVVQITGWQTASRSISNVTYNGVSLTRIGGHTVSVSGEFLLNDAWIMFDPPVGASHNVVVTASGSLETFIAEISAWQDVVQSAPSWETGTSGNFSNSSGPYTSGALDTVADDVVITGFQCYNATSFTLTPNGTQMHEGENDGDADSYNFFYNAATGASVTPQVTSSTNLDQHIMFSFVLPHEAGGGGGSSIVRQMMHYYQ